MLDDLAAFLGIDREHAQTWLEQIHGRTKLPTAFGRLWPADPDAGYRFDDKKLLDPRHEVMCTRKPDVTMILEVKSDKDDGLGKEARIRAAVDGFFDGVWEWGSAIGRVECGPGASEGRVPCVAGTA